MTKKNLGIKYNTANPAKTLDQYAYEALTQQLVDSGLPGSSGWYKTVRNKALMLVVDIVLDAYAKYGRNKLIALVQKTGFDANTSAFIIKLIEKFGLFLSGTKSFRDAKEQTINAVITKFGSFITGEEKVDFKYTIDHGTDRQVAESIVNSVKEKSDEVQQKWQVQHTESKQATDQEDINETIIPELEKELPKSSTTAKGQNQDSQSQLPSTTQTSDKSKDETQTDNKGMWIAMSISIVTLIGFLAFVIYSVNKKGNRRRR